MPPPASSRPVVLLVAATACWGIGTVLSKHVLERGVAPLTLLVVELAASSLLLSVVLLAIGARAAGPALPRLALLGILNPGLAYALGLLGLASISASMSVLLWATEPVLIVVIAVLVLSERISASTVATVVAALTGVLLVVFRPGAQGDVVGITLTVAAVVACACYTVLTQRHLLDDSSLSVVLAQQAVALVFALVLAGSAAALGLADLGLPASPSTWALAAVSGIVYYGLAFWCFVGGLRDVPASVAGVFLPLIPVFGLVAAYATGDRLLGRQWLGAAVVVLAVLAAALRQLRSARIRPGAPGPTSP